MTDLPPGWTVVPLHDLVDVLDSRRKPVSAKERADRIGDVPYYGAAGQVGSIDGALFDEDLVLLGEDGVQFFDPFKSKAYLISGPAWVNNHAHVLRARPAIDRRYLHYYLNSFDYRGFANGTTRLKLTQAAMNRIPVRLPPLAEQRRILVALEAHLSRVESGVKQIRRAEGRLLRLIEFFGQSVEAEISTEPVALLGELLADPLRNGYSAPAVDGGDVRIITLTAVTRSDFFEVHSKMTAADHARVRDLWLKPGDVLIQRSNTPELVGTAALYSGPTDWAVFPDLVIRVRLKPEVLPAFATLMLKTPRARKYFRSKAKGLAGSMPKIDQQAIEKFELKLPSLERQGDIVRRADVVSSLVHSAVKACRVASRRASQIRASLLAEAFAGRLVPQDPNDEPASDLLARIKPERTASIPRQRTRSGRTSRELPAPPTRVTGGDYEQEALPL